MTRPSEPRYHPLFLGASLAALLVLGGVLYVTVMELTALDIETRAEDQARRIPYVHAIGGK